MTERAMRMLGLGSWAKWVREPAERAGCPPGMLLPDPMDLPPGVVQRTLVLSLEDTLIHTEWDRKFGHRTRKRPGLDAFLAHMSQYYEIVIFTSALSSYAEPITRQMLDRMVSDIPFIMGCFDHHTMWANTRALEAAGIMKGRELPVGNEIVLDHNGIATGELREPAAYMLVQALTPTGGREWLGMTTGENPNPPATAAQRELDIGFFKKGIAHAASLGITSMHNMDGNWYQLELLQTLLDRGEMHARVEVPFHQKNTFEIARVEEFLGLPGRERTARILRALADGAIAPVLTEMSEVGRLGRSIEALIEELMRDAAEALRAHGLGIEHPLGDYPRERLVLLARGLSALRGGDRDLRRGLELLAFELAA